MTSVAGRRLSTASPEKNRPGYLSGACWAIPGAVTLGICLWRIGTPTYWRDESVSVVVGHSGVGGIRDFTEHIDAVHRLYYLLMDLVTLFGTDEAVTRAPSAMAAALAAVGIAVLGRRLHSARAGLYGGLLYGLLPITSRYGQEVRQYAIVSAGAVLATYLLLRALQGPRHRIAWYAAYAGAMGLLGWLHLYALFLLPAHGLTVAIWNGDGRIRRLACWGSAALVSVLAVVPLVLSARGQEGTQVSWLSRPGAGALYDFGLLIAGSGVVLALLVAAVAAGLVGRGQREAVALVVPWLLVPVAVAWTISQAHPVYHPRYVLYSVCAFALLAGMGLATAGSWVPARRAWVAPAATAVALVCLAAAVLPDHVAMRGPRSRPDDLRGLATVLRRSARPGDAVVYLPADRRVFATAYAGAFARLNAAPLHDGGKDLPTPRFKAALAAQSRIWVVEIPPPGHRYRTPVPMGNRKALRADARFHAAAGWNFGGVLLTLFERKHKAA
ncbi:glycosyltransferase family 39 protein [Actinomadura roseirufa]|uniref:glycosyltransferase family 39 protein n=1 Tax=Actinomadura roseirufa TaxID=2094049 RepID=UPI0013F1550A|nr:glycosyltransferase family 39 protein [Actinomadura roseirufa]